MKPREHAGITGHKLYWDFGNFVAPGQEESFADNFEWLCAIAQGQGRLRRGLPHQQLKGFRNVAKKAVAALQTFANWVSSSDGQV
jgi:hypothetical protein